MSALILPGQNCLSLCPRALCNILQAHLREASYASKDVRVLGVMATGNYPETRFMFTITTDPDTTEVPKNAD